MRGSKVLRVGRWWFGSGGASRALTSQLRLVRGQHARSHARAAQLTQHEGERVRRGRRRRRRRASQATRVRRAVRNQHLLVGAHAAGRAERHVGVSRLVAQAEVVAVPTRRRVAERPGLFRRRRAQHQPASSRFAPASNFLRHRSALEHLHAHRRRRTLHQLAPHHAHHLVFAQRVTREEAARLAARLVRHAEAHAGGCGHKQTSKRVSACQAFGRVARVAARSKFHVRMCVL